MQFRFILLFLFLTSSLTASATIWVVSSSADTGTGSLREIVTNAADGDTITFSVNSPIQLEDDIQLGISLVMIGDASGNDIISTTGQSRIFDLANDQTLRLEHLTLSNGYTGGLAQEGGGAIRNSGTVYATDCLFLNNQAESGGAIVNISFGGDTSLLYLESCSFVGNYAYQGDSTTLSEPTGGAIYADTRQYGYTEIIATNCTFSDNKADGDGGALYMREIPFGSSKVEFRHCTIARNSAGSGPGGFYGDIGRFHIFEACLIAENEGDLLNPNIKGTFESEGNNLFTDTLGADFKGPSLPSDLVSTEAGIIDLVEFSPRQWLHALTCSSPANEHIMPSDAPAADQRGEARVGMAEIGAYERVEATDLGLTNSNDSGIGSLRFFIDFHCKGQNQFLPALADTIHLRSPLIIDEQVSLALETTSPMILHGGDSIRIFDVEPGAALSLDGFTLCGGSAGNFGGGAIRNQGELAVENCSFVFNSATGGGAIANYPSGTDTIFFFAQNCTFSHNQALWLDGGAIDNRSFNGSVFAEIYSCTFAFNDAYVRGGAIYHGENSTLQMKNTLVDRNLAPIGEQIYGDISSQGFNLIRNPEGIFSGISPNDVIDIPSNILSLDMYGGPTPTHPLPFYSVAVDAGDPGGASTNMDQRGLLRVFGGTIDIGAVEYQGLTSVSEELNTGIKLYPNPGKQFTLSFEEREGMTSVTILSMTGQVVWSGNINTDIQSELYLEPEVSPGTYLLQVNSQLRRQALRLIVQ